MPHSPLVSIIIPCYNAEDFIRNAIQSALDQIHPNIEVIVIDDGSTDESLSIIRAFGEQVRWETGPNRGGCRARNRGLELSSGEWIQFHDADDILLDNCVKEKLNANIPTDCIPCCDVAFLDHPSVHAFGGDSGYTLHYALKFGAPQTAGPLYRKDSLMAVGGFKPNLPCAQDYDLAIRVMIENNLSFHSIGKIGVLKRELDNSVSNSSQAKMSLTKLEILTTALFRLKETDQLEDSHQHAISIHMANLARDLWQYGEDIPAIEAAKLSQTLWAKGYLSAYKRSYEKLGARLLGFSNFERTYRQCKKGLRWVHSQLKPS